MRFATVAPRISGLGRWAFPTRTSATPSNFSATALVANSTATGPTFPSATTAPPWHRARVAARERVSRPGRDAVDAPPTQAKKVEGKSLDTQCGTPGYVAPEILKGKKYGTAVDMWSCGVIVYILLGGYPPFHDDNHAILYRKIKAADYAFDPQYWDQVSDDAKDLIKKMLVVDPDKRSIPASGRVESRHQRVSIARCRGWFLFRF